MPTPSPLRVFISYSSKDKSLLEDLETHLTSLRRQGAILEWSNRAIIAGQDTQAAVSDNLKQADIILLLVSSDFLASQAAWDHEVTQALKRHDDGKARVIPILLRPVDLTNVPFAHLAPLPTNARPITRWSNRDDAWLDVATAIGRVIEQETRQRTCPLPPELPPATFVGRTEEMEVAVRRLQTDGVRMLTISGIFGIGKTRLASEAVLKLRRYFRDGICPVMLSRFDEHGLVASDIRAALDAPESSAQSLESSLQAFLLDKQVLLVLDRFDTARTAESLQLIHGLIGAALGLKVLITSREPIPIQFGYQAELGLLPLRTQRSTWDASGSATSASEAAQLFIAFAETMGTTIDTEHDIAAVESICTKIGGHPQTINLIAGWLKTSPLDQTDADLSEYVILSAGDDEPLRHAWNESFQRLNAGPQSVLAMLSVFRGPFAKEAATEVVQTDDGSPLQVLPVFKVLAERGFLQRESLGDGQLTGRYWIFETIRQYAKEMLDSGQWQAAQHRHATYFLKLAETAELEIEGSRQVEGLADVRDDYSNIRAALRRSKASGNVELSLRLAGALGPYWYHRGDFTEGRTWLKELLASPGMVNPVIRAKALDFAGILASYQGDPSRGRRVP
jgi:predicted ATPase